MKDINAHQLLAKVMAWKDEDPVRDAVPRLQLLADYKYDQYQQFGPGQRFFESLALWLKQFSEPAERETALSFVLNDLVFLSDKELSHLVRLAYRDVIVQERLKLVAQEQGIPMYRVKRIVGHPRFADLEKKSLYLGLSDGARTNELRRASELRIKNDQIWQAYELSDAKVLDMLQALREDLAPTNTSEADALSEIEAALSKGDRGSATRILSQKLSESKNPSPHLNSKFNIVWLIDDFSGSGNTYIRYDPEAKVFKGKIKKIYSQLQIGDLVDTSHYEVYLLLYVATLD